MTEVAIGNGLIAPLQTCSRRSLTKMLDAAERLLLRKDFDVMSIAEIAAEAGVSVGNFYTRFSSKEAMLDVLHERYERERAEFLSRAFTGADQPTHNLAIRTQLALEAIVALFRKRRGVLRSLILHHWRNPKGVSRQTYDRVDAIINSANALFLNARDEIRHEDPETAVRVGVSASLSACREAIVLRPPTLPGTTAVGDSQLARELARMLHAYLTNGAIERDHS